MVRQAMTGTPVKHIETTQDAIIARGVETHEDAFRAVSGDLEETGAGIAASLEDLVTGAKMPLSAIKPLRAKMSSLAADLDGAADELRNIIVEAEAHEACAMSDYDHSHALKEVTVRDDRTHVEAMLRKLDAYAQSGGKEALGDFLKALVVGDLAEATAHADGVNIKYLRTYMRYLYCRVPRTHVNLGRPALRVIRESMNDEGQSISQAMVAEALEGFASRLRALMQE